MRDIVIEALPLALCNIFRGIERLRNCHSERPSRPALSAARRIRADAKQNIGMNG